MTESFAELFEESLVSQSLKPGTIVTGTVVEIRDDAVVRNAGLKSEGIVPIYQFRSLSGRTWKSQSPLIWRPPMQTSNF